MLLSKLNTCLFLLSLVRFFFVVYFSYYVKGGEFPSTKFSMQQILYHRLLVHDSSWSIYLDNVSWGDIQIVLPGTRTEHGDLNLVTTPHINNAHQLNVTRVLPTLVNSGHLGYHSTISATTWAILATTHYTQL